MLKNLIDPKWNNIDEYSQEEITYFLYIEGKGIDALCKIRNLDKITVKRQILEGKIKYGILAKSSNVSELFKALSSSGKQDRSETLNYIKDDLKKDLIKFIKENYAEMYPKDKQFAVWILGEIGDKEGLKVLTKASVHKFVNIRRMAVSAIGKIGDLSGENALVRALEDENSQVVSYAIKALKRIKSLKGQNKILKIKNTTKKDYLKRVAGEYLDSIEKN